MTVSNSVGKVKLKYDDIRDLVLTEEVRKKDSGELLDSGFILNVDYRAEVIIGIIKAQIRVD